MKSPADLDYPSDKYDLPPLNIKTIYVESPIDFETLFPTIANTLSERREARKESLNLRVSKAAELVNNSDEQWIVWCDFNAESEALAKAISGAVEVKGADRPEHKENSAIAFANGDIKALVSKSSIYGFGMNWQNCHNVIFCGLSDSYEQFYQAVRRCWRFGQDKPVNVYVIISEREESVLQNIKRKQSDADRMSENMVKLTAEITKSEIKKTVRITETYKPKSEMRLPEWLKEAC
jgi:superfamily II DNA helicase RecQ